MPRAPAHHRHHLNVNQKLDLVAHARWTGWHQAKLADWVKAQFGVPLSRQTVGNILRNAAQLAAVPVRRRSAKRFVSDPAFVTLDTAIVARVDEMDDFMNTVTGELIIEAARHVADELGIPTAARPKFSNGWLQKFQRRWGYACKRKHGEAASVGADVVSAGRAKMLKLTQQYAPKDVFNMDETSFFYRALANHTITRRDHVAGRKHSKVRMTLALAANADGSEKLKPLFIGTARVPRAFHKNDVSTIDATYESSANAWMTSSLFRDWVNKLDAEMREKDRHILLLIDNTSSHASPTIPVTNVRMEYIPKNTTSVLQPMDQGIIACVKAAFAKIRARVGYRDFLMGRGDRLVNVFDAMEWATEAWATVTRATIRNCWLHSGIVPDPRKIPVS